MKITKPKPLAWLLAAGDSMSIGPTVPARMRVLWGIAVLVALSWLIVLQYKQLDQSQRIKTMILETAPHPETDK